MSTRNLRALEWPMAVLALVLIPALVLEDRATDPRLREAAHVFNWIVWLAFCVEFGVRWIARGSVRFLREAWFDLRVCLLRAQSLGRIRNGGTPCALSTRRARR